jgi:hypothetical protein
MKLKRKKFKKPKKDYDEGLRTNAPDEKWYADITEIQNGRLKDFLHLFGHGQLFAVHHLMVYRGQGVRETEN